MIFTSVNNKYSIYGSPKLEGKQLVPEYIVNFNPIGTMGRFQTEDEELASKLRSHPDFGKRFMEIGITAKENPSIVVGLRSSETKPELGKEPIDPQKLIEFGGLQATLLKKDGSYRKDASEEQIKQYEQLKKELERNKMAINSRSLVKNISSMDYISISMYCFRDRRYRFNDLNNTRRIRWIQNHFR